MKNNLFKLTALLVVVVGLVSCRGDESVLPITENLANKTLLGFYTYTTLDSVTMRTSSKEFFLTRDEKDEQNGYYRTNEQGNGVALDESLPLTWTSKMAVDKLSMLIDVIMNNDAKSIVWQDGVVKIGDQWYEKNIAGVSNIDNLNTIYNKQLANVVFEISETEYHPHTKKVPYLAWDAARRSNVAEQDTAKVKQDYLDKLLPQADTIIWFLKNKTPNGYIGNRVHCVDTVIGGRDTTIIVDLVYVTGTGPYTVYYLKSSKKSDEVQVDDWPKSVLFSNMIFNRDANNLTTATYKWQKSEFSLEHYLLPGKAADTGTDSVYTFTASAWVVPEYTNLAKFDVMMLGTGDSVISKIEAGVESIVKSETYPNIYQTLNLSGYGEEVDLTDSTVYIKVIQNNLEYRLKQ